MLCSRMLADSQDFSTEDHNERRASLSRDNRDRNGRRRNQSSGVHDFFTALMARIAFRFLAIDTSLSQRVVALTFLRPT